MIIESDDIRVNTKSDAVTEFRRSQAEIEVARSPLFFEIIYFIVL
ncbi:MAG: hypothetical protein Q3993_01300 [Filifactor alocis]|nr:hypothetical protein [Filifactor alocis]